MNKAFSEYVTGASFSLSLSKNQITHLVLVANNSMPMNYQWFKQFNSLDNTVPARRVLQRKGLIKNSEQGIKSDCFYPELTKAGKLTMQLLQEAGLVESIEKALEGAETRKIKK